MDFFFEINAVSFSDMHIWIFLLRPIKFWWDWQSKKESNVKKKTIRIFFLHIIIQNLTNFDRSLISLQLKKCQAMVTLTIFVQKVNLEQK